MPSQKRTLLQDTQQAEELSQTFAAVFMFLVDLPLPWDADIRSGFLAVLTPCVEVVGKLFLLDDVELAKRSNDQWALNVRLTSWFLELESSYHGGARGLARMAVRFAAINGQIQSGIDPAHGDIEYVVDRTSVLENITRLFASFSENIDCEIGAFLEVLEAQREESHAEIVDFSEIGEIEDLIGIVRGDSPEAIMVYSHPLSEYRRRYFLIDPSKSNASLISVPEGTNVKTQSPISNNVIALMELLEGIESYADLSYESHFFEVIIGPSGDWEDFEDDLEDVILAWFGTTNIGFLCLENFQEDDEEDD